MKLQFKKQWRKALNFGAIFASAALGVSNIAYQTNVIKDREEQANKLQVSSLWKQVEQYDARLYSDIVTSFDQINSLGHTSPLYTPPENIAEGETPETLIVIPTFGQVVGTGNFQTTIGRLYKGFSQMELLSGDIDARYTQPLVNIIAYEATGSENLRPAAEQAELIFTAETEVLIGHQTVNKFGSVSKDRELIIQHPTAAYDVFTHGSGSYDPTVSPQETTIPANFMYQVASVAITDMPEDGAAEFIIEDMTDDTYSYELVISNANNVLADYLALDQADQPTTSDLVDSRSIFLRSTSYDDSYDYGSGSPSPVGQLDGTLFVRQNGVNIDIYIAPDTDTTKQISFSIKDPTTPTASGAVRYGILDDSLSPMYTMEAQSGAADGDRWAGITSPIASLPIEQGATSTFNANAISSTWAARNNYPVTGGTIGTAESLRLYMKPGTKIEEALSFMRQGSDAFENQNNNLTIDYDIAGAASVFPSSRFSIRADVYNMAGNVDPLSVSMNEITQTTAAGFTQDWLQVDIMLQQGVLQMNPSATNEQVEDAYRLRTVADQIFFELPTGATSVSPEGNGQTTISVDQITEVTDEYKAILGAIYSNWSSSSGITADSDPESNNYDGRYIAPDTTLFPNSNLDAHGWQTFWAQYTNYYEDEDGRLIKKRTSNELVAEDAFGRDIIGPDGNVVILPPTGVNLVEKLNEYTNRLSTWAITKLNVSADQVREENHYLLENASESIGFVDKIIVDSSGAVGNDLAVWADALVRYWSGAQNSEEEERLIQAFLNSDMNQTFDIERTLKDVAMPSGDGTPVDTTTAEYHHSLQILYHIISPQFANTINELFLIEETSFENFKGGILGNFMESFMVQEVPNGVGINASALFRFRDAELPDDLQGIQLMSIYGNTTTNIRDGEEAINSLLAFIYAFNLQGRYLSQARADNFNTLYTDGSFTNVEIYKDDAQIHTVREMMSLLDEIVSGILVGDGKSLSDIVDDILTIRNHDPVPDLRNAIQDSINKITRGANTITYEFFGRTFGSNYLENLVMGYNIQSIVEKYIELNDEDLSPAEKTTLEFHLGSAAWNSKSITQLAVNMGYYNVDYFIMRLTEQETVPAMASEILGSNLGRNLLIEIPDSNNLVDFLADSSAMYTYAMAISGSILFIVGMITVLLSFRSSNKQQSTIKTQLIFRVIFLTVAILGGLLGASGFILPVLG